jgi:hypothetical protein
MLRFSLNVLIDRFALITGPSTSVTCKRVSRSRTNRKAHAPRINKSGVPSPSATPIPIWLKPPSPPPPAPLTLLVGGAGSDPLIEPGRVGNPGNTGAVLFVFTESEDDVVSAVFWLSVDVVGADVVVMWNDIVVTVSAATSAL